MSLRLTTLSRCARPAARRLCFSTGPWRQELSLLSIRQPRVRSPIFKVAGSQSVDQKRQTSEDHARLEEAQAPELVVTERAHEEDTASLIACPGCGALAQTIESGEAGYYSTRRKAISSFVTPVADRDGVRVVQEALSQVDPQILASLGLGTPATSEDSDLPAQHPLCDRCHNLLHHHVGVPIVHPSVDSLADTIQESPHKYNHIYHVLDAADFPYSLVPRLHAALAVSAQRSKNRRSKHFKYIHGKVTEVTFVITRSDLLAPKKEQVDSLMPYLIEVLRDALGSSGRNVRLGNVCCVSAKRGWWVKELKADIWERGGGGWMVGKVNVGKSNLFEVVFPKGRAEDIDFQSVRSKARFSGAMHERRDLIEDAQTTAEISRIRQAEEENEDSLLPPVRAETPYPIMPIISSLPGTTASPIRIPFGNGRGELIDLPGLARGDFETVVRPEHHESLLMKSRLTPEQYVIKPGSSLLLGGLIRITPLDPDIVILAYPFLNLAAHLTSTDKATAIQAGQTCSGVPGLFATEAAQASMSSAGKFHLKWDVTKQRSGPLTSKSAAGLKPQNLPFIVLSADILVEGVGWVELVAQVRKKKQTRLEYEHDMQEPTTGGYGWDETAIDKRRRQRTEPIAEPVQFPEVEVFSPEGKFVALRRPMNAWVLGGLQSRPGKSSQRGRPRKSMKNAGGNGARRSDFKDD